MSSDASPAEEDQPFRAEVVGPARVAPTADGNGDHPPAAPKAPRFDATAPSASTIPLRSSAGRPRSTVADAEQHRQMVGAEHAAPRQRRVMLPLVLFLLTCAATFWAGCLPDQPEVLLEAFQYGKFDRVRMAIVANWQNGLIYMSCVLAILLTHEMGHFLMTLRYRIAASLPYFIPVPITPIGTMGAVISMDGLSANRRQIFDIGLAGPIAGLVVALPIMWYGAHHVNLENFDARRMKYEARLQYDLPQIVHWMMAATPPKGYENVGPVAALPTSRLNPFFMAGWVGLLITGLNMLPISQLDGGHVIYALFGKRAHAIARMFLFGAILFVVWDFEKAYGWLAMIVLVTLLGTDHPPTADDDMPLGPLRTIIGWVSLLIPVLCFPIYALSPIPP